MNEKETLPICANLRRLIAAHPALLREEGLDPFSYVSDGWFGLVDTLCTDLEISLGDRVAELRVCQIKEKFGSLRFYLQWPQAAGNPELSAIVCGLIDAAEAASKNVCERCGSPDCIRNEGRSLCDALA